MFLYKEQNHQETILTEVQQTELSINQLHLYKEQNHQEAILKTEVVLTTPLTQDLKAHSVLNHQEEVRNQEAASHREKAVLAQEKADEEDNLNISIFYLKLKAQFGDCAFFYLFNYNCC